MTAFGQSFQTFRAPNANPHRRSKNDVRKWNHVRFCGIASIRTFPQQTSFPCCHVVLRLGSRRSSVLHSVSFGWIFHPGLVKDEARLIASNPQCHCRLHLRGPESCRSFSIPMSRKAEGQKLPPNPPGAGGTGII